MAALEDVLDNIRREKRELQRFPDIAPIDVIPLCQF